MMSHHLDYTLGVLQLVLLPLSLLVVIVGCQAFHGIHPQGNHPVDLGLHLLLVGYGVRKVRVNELLHPQISPNANADSNKAKPEDRLPLPGWSFNLHQGLAEACSIKSLLLFLGQFLPVTFLLLSKSCNLSNIFLKSDCWKWSHHAVNISCLAVSTKTYHFSLANIHLGLGKWDTNMSTHRSGGQLGHHGQGLRHEDTVLTNKASHV